VAGLDRSNFRRLLRRFELDAEHLRDPEKPGGVRLTPGGST
jgi:hypothetical protein